MAARLGMQTTRQTILRRIMDLPDISTGVILFLGIDDFSFRRGCRFGTILVNLESRRVVDLLPDREAETSATWMRQQLDLMAVSRDRGGAYASAAAQGAPQAIQCADRFHLMKNLGEALEGLLAHHLAAECKRQTQATLDGQAPVWQPKRAAKSSPKLEHLQQARREERLAHYEQVIALRKLGMSQQAIARQVGIGASTVQSWLAAGTFPERKPREQASQLDRYLPYLFERWSEGCHIIAVKRDFAKCLLTCIMSGFPLDSHEISKGDERKSLIIACLFRELVELGYRGSYESVRDNMVRLLPTGRKNTATSSSMTPALVTS